MAKAKKRKRVLRGGKIEEVPHIRVGDIWLGKCWGCKQQSRITRLANGHDRHGPLVGGGILEGVVVTESDESLFDA